MAGIKIPPSQNEWWLADILVQFRWLIVVPIVLPMSFLFDLYWRVRDWYYKVWKRAPEEHDKRVKHIQTQMNNWRKSGSKELLCTSRKPWLTISTRVAEYKKKENAIDVDLWDILDVNFEKKTVTVEPLVNIGQLTHFLVPQGWTLPVVPEMDDLTVSGLILGYGVECSSHKYGLFSEIVKSMEVVVADGSIVRCSRTENVELFDALPWSLGALGFLVKVELQIIPCKPYVKLDYIPVHSLKEMCDVFEKYSCMPNPPEFVESIQYAPDRGVVMVGEFSDNKKEKLPVNAIGWWFKPWFYKHVETFLMKGRKSEAIPLREYYHRHTKAIFWEAELIVPFGNHPLFRWLLGWLMPPKVSFLKLTQGEKIREYYADRHVAQDGLVPINRLLETLEYFHEIWECYPLWFAPMNVIRRGGAIRPAQKQLDEEMFVDIGAYYAPGRVLRGEPFDGAAATRKFEAFMTKIGGYQCLHAVTELTREEYNAMFDMTLYNQMRKKLGAEGVFMDAYDKVKRNRKNKKPAVAAK
eukprot:jgi/Mesvir1/27102/Mv20784-RA.1